MASVKVKLLDDSIRRYNVKPKTNASLLIQEIMKDIDVLESDYFGILYRNEENEMTFLDPLKPLNKQIKSFSQSDLEFVVKFFPPDPGQLQEEYTRYLFALQMKRDLLSGLMTCGENTSLVMASLIIQEDFGEWTSSECSDIEYLRNFKILNNPTDEQLENVMELHKKLANLTPSDTDYKLLDVARRLEHYGIRMHPARDHENMDIFLAVNHAGLLVFRGMTKINTFNWARIRKLSFKRKRFLIKLRQENQKSGSTVGDILIFVMKSRNSCKNFWRICIEYHAFFRLDVRPQIPKKAVILSRGSSFRYRGKTQKELITLVRESNYKRTDFTRSKSARRPPRSTNNAPVPRRHSLEAPVIVQDTKPQHESTQNQSSEFEQSHDDTITNSPNSREITADISQEKSPQKHSVVTTPATEAPEWQEGSKSLHSSATPIPSVTDDSSTVAEGTTNTISSLQMHVSMVDIPPLHSNVDNNKNFNTKNDGKTDGLCLRTNSYNHTLPGFDSFCWRQDITGFGNDVLKQCNISANYPPPIPPKLRSPNRNHSNNNNTVRDSLISTTSGVSQIIPESNVERSERKITEGFYCQPRKLPTLTQSSLSPLLKHARSFEIDPEVREMLIQSYEQNGSTVLESTSVEDSFNGKLGVLIDSDTDSSIEPGNNPLLSPIEMNFDDDNILL